MKRGLWVTAIVLLSVSALADTVVLSSGSIECEVVRIGSLYTRLRLQSGGIMMVYTDSIREIQYSNPVLVNEQQLPSLQVVDTTGISPAVPAEAPKPMVADAIRPATLPIVAREAGTGFIGGLGLGLVTSLVGGLVSIRIAGNPTNFADRLFAWIDGMNIGMLVGYTAGNALGVSYAGWRLHQGGHLWASACGAATGALVGAAWFSVDTSSAKLSATACVLLPMVGAVIGYNLSRPRLAVQSSFLDRLDMPTVSLQPSGEEQTPIQVNVRLLSLRF